ncbi:PEP-CTERM sorting domain-containing protein [Aquincola tertiaricarbonis]|uniref:PEP-CTERM sorting domain-containing protein n=1 Tax=Aquincola tertiaricarbonis TaxID=391953 RepID=UPI0012EE0D36|nr:PEP-CTERM sorting domain-containing protein [Aquincola tertiaricarbonis]
MAKRDAMILGVVLAGLAAFGTPAQAASELVVNGGFEQQDFAGWISGGDTDFNLVNCTGGGQTAFAGSCSAAIGSLSDSSLVQSVNVGAAGLTYNLSFAFQSDGAAGSSFSVSFGGQTLVSMPSPGESPYTLYQFSGQTTGADMLLAFSFASPGGTLYLDAVSVTAVPEPATMGLMGAGLLVLGAAARRRVKQA